jgi:phosphatidylglycerol:prolipoprotein diacylglycerol transferase
MRFPTDPAGHAVLGLGGLDNREKELAIQRAMEDGTWERVKDQVPLRHPSQIYEALAEGLLLGACLWTVYLLTRRRPVGAGVYAGIFLLGYGVLRFVIEYFRQPDEHFQKTADTLGTVLWGLSMGQVLCLAMILAGVVVVLWRRGKRLPSDPQEQSSSSVAAQT